jgi:hypothetical protein
MVPEHIVGAAGAFDPAQQLQRFIHFCQACVFIDDIAAEYHQIDLRSGNRLHGLLQPGGMQRGTVMHVCDQRHAKRGNILPGFHRILCPDDLAHIDGAEGKDRGGQEQGKGAAEVNSAPDAADRAKTAKPPQQLARELLCERKQHEVHKDQSRQGEGVCRSERRERREQHTRHAHLWLLPVKAPAARHAAEKEPGPEADRQAEQEKREQIKEKHAHSGRPQRLLPPPQRVRII